MGLNRLKPFGVVCGDSFAKYYQAGKHYDSDGNEVDVETGKIIEKAKKIDFIGTVEPVVKTPAPVDDAPVEDLNGLPWQTVKKMVEGAGGVWTNKGEGLAFLQNQS